MEWCPECGLQFGSCEDRDSHILKSHKKQTNPSVLYQCQSCQRTWHNYMTLYKHQRTCAKNNASTVRPFHSNILGFPEDVDMEEPLLCGNVESDEADVDDDESDTGVEIPNSQDVYSEAIFTAEEQLQEEVIDFLVHLKEDCNSTQTLVDEVVAGVNRVHKKFLAVVAKLLIQKAGQAEVLSVEEVSEVLHDLQEMSVFDGIGHKDDLLEYLVENEGLVLPEKVPFLDSTIPTIKNQKLVAQDGDVFYQVDFLSQLQRVLNNEDVMHCILNPRKSEPFVYRDILDGLLYRNHVLVLKFNSEVVLCIIFYHDGVEVVDTASPRAGKHSMTFFYWVLGNIYPELRCTDKAINLYAIAKTAHVKMYRYSKIMKNFKEVINSLESEEGVTFTVDGKKMKFHGELHAVEGDFPAQAVMGGFKESVTAEKPCRNCLASNKGNYLMETDVSKFELRNEETHRQHLFEVEQYLNLSAQERAGRSFDPSVEYGVNGNGVLYDLKYFERTKRLPEDILHVAHEGVLELTCRLVLQNVIVNNKLSLEEINRRIAMFALYFPSDRPGEISEKNFALGKKLRQSAAQTRVLSLVLPFALHVKDVETDEWIFAGERRYLDCLVSLLKVMQLALAFEHHLQDVDILKRKIQEFHRRLLEICPDLTMAKAHFLHHLPDMIVLFGSIRQVSTFRMEGHHAIFKHLLKIMHNFVNPMLSIATRHQTRQCRQMMKGAGMYLYAGHKFTAVRDVTKLVDRNVNGLKKLFPNHQKITELSRLTMYGTVYRRDSLVLVSNQEPQFAAIQKIYMVDDAEFYFVCQNMVTTCHHSDVNAYELKPAVSSTLINAQELVYPHDVINIRWLSKSFALPLGHRTFLV